MTNKPKPQYDSIIFDLDGTLWNSTANVTLALQMAANAMSYTGEAITEDRVNAATGLTHQAFFQALFPEFNNDQIKEILQCYAVSERETVYKTGGKLYPQIKETLAALKSTYTLFIVSNCASGYIETFLDLNNLHAYFTGHQCFGTKGNPKADNIRDVITDYKLKAPVYVGDTVMDQRAATEAGIPFIFASYGFGTVQKGMVATIDSFADLQNIL